MQSAVIVTGSCGGIGSVLCSILKDEGYYVIATDSVSGKCVCDVFVQQDLNQLLLDEDVAAKFRSELHKHLDDKSLAALINNAAIQLLGSLEELSLEDFIKTMNINVAAPLSLSKMLLAELTESVGTIINIGSIHSKLTKKGFISYATSKSALLGLSRALAVDLGASGIRVNVIQPAATETEMLLAGFEGKELKYQDLSSYHPLNRIAKPEEIAYAVLFLINGKCGFMSGSVLDIDGGVGVRLHDPD